VLLPHRAAVEGLQRPRAGLHVREAAEPDEAVRVVEVAELPDDAHAASLLALDEVLVEDPDQGVARPRM
jgi:hypothetical protein